MHGYSSCCYNNKTWFCSQHLQGFTKIQLTPLAIEPCNAACSVTACSVISKRRKKIYNMGLLLGGVYRDFHAQSSATTRRIRPQRYCQSRSCMNRTICCLFGSRCVGFLYSLSSETTMKSVAISSHGYTKAFPLQWSHLRDDVIYSCACFSFPSS